METWTGGPPRCGENEGGDKSWEHDACTHACSSAGKTLLGRACLEEVAAAAARGAKTLAVDTDEGKFTSIRTSEGRDDSKVPDPRPPWGGPDGAGRQAADDGGLITRQTHG
jgi:hypothetical protein